MTTSLMKSIDQIVQTKNMLEIFLGNLKEYEIARYCDYSQKYEKEKSGIAIQKLNYLITVLENGERVADKIEFEQQILANHIEETLKNTKVLIEDCIKNKEIILNGKIEMIESLKKREEEEHNELIQKLNKELQKEKNRFIEKMRENNEKIEITKKGLGIYENKPDVNPVQPPISHPTIIQPTVVQPTIVQLPPQPTVVQSPIYVPPPITLSGHNETTKPSDKTNQKCFIIDIDDEDEIIKEESLDESSIKEQAKKRIEEWSKLKFTNNLFNSSKDNWEYEKSVLGEKIFDKKGIAFIITDTNSNVFGGFVNEIINKKECYINDVNSFLFSIVKDKQKKLLKFDVDNSKYAFYLGETGSKRLFAFGFGGNDLTVMKKGEDGSKCKQKSFKYNGLSLALCGSEQFTPQTIEVWQFE